MSVDEQDAAEQIIDDALARRARVLALVGPEPESRFEDATGPRGEGEAIIFSATNETEKIIGYVPIRRRTPEYDAWHRAFWRAWHDDRCGPPACA